MVLDHGRLNATHRVVRASCAFASCRLRGSVALLHSQGLSLLGDETVEKIDAAHALPVRVLDRIRAGQTVGGKVTSAVQSFIGSSFPTRVEYEAWVLEHKGSS